MFESESRTASTKKDSEGISRRNPGRADPGEVVPRRQRGPIRTFPNHWRHPGNLGRDAKRGPRDPPVRRANSTDAICRAVFEVAERPRRATLFRDERCPEGGRPFGHLNSAPMGLPTSPFGASP